MDGRRFYCVVNHTAYNTSHSLEERSASFLIRVKGEDRGCKTTDSNVRDVF